MVWKDLFSGLLGKGKKRTLEESQKIARIKEAIASMKPYTGNDKAGLIVHNARMQRDLQVIILREQLDPKTLLDILTGLEAVHEHDIKEQLQASRNVTLRDIRRLRELDARQLRTLTILTARYLSSEEERLRMPDEKYLIGLPETQQSGFDDEDMRKMHSIVMKFFWSPNQEEIAKLISSNPLFSHAGPFKTMIDDAVANKNIGTLIAQMSSYPAEGVVAAANGLNAKITDMINLVFTSILRKESNMEHATKRAIMKTSGRLAAAVLLAMLFGNGLFGRFELLRKTSREMINDTTAAVEDSYRDDVKQRSPEDFSISGDDFEKNRDELLGVLEKEARTYDIDQSIVVQENALDEEILAALRNLYTPTVRTQAVHITTGLLDKITSAWNGVLDREDRWHQYERGQLKGMRDRCQTALDELFTQKKFIKAVKKDMEKGLIEVTYAHGTIQEYLLKGKNAAASGSKELTSAVLSKSVSIVLDAINDTFKSLFGLFWGSITGNDALKDESKNYLMMISAVLAALGVIGLALFVWLGGAAYGILRGAKLALRWTYRAGELSYKLMLAGVVSDVQNIVGTVSVFDVMMGADEARKKRLIDMLDRGQTIDQTMTLDVS